MAMLVAQAIKRNLESVNFTNKTIAFKKYHNSGNIDYDRVKKATESINVQPISTNQSSVTNEPTKVDVIDELLDLASEKMSADDYTHYTYFAHHAATSLPEDSAKMTIITLTTLAGKAKIDYSRFYDCIIKVPCYATANLTEKDISVAYQQPAPKLEKRVQETEINVDSIIDELLSKYDIKVIDSSIIKYYQAVQQWADDIINLLDRYEKEKESVIHDFNNITLQLSKRYEKSPNLTEEENELLEKRQKYFQKRFSIGMDSIKSKILSIKKQADNLEYRINEINEGDNSIQELALIEKEDRASFLFITENTAKMTKDVVSKIEYFEHNRGFILTAVKIWSDWSEDYRVFKTTYKEDLKNICEEDGIEEEIWTEWYESWRSVRFAIEQKVQPLIEYGLKADIPTENQGEETVIEQMISILVEYKNKIDRGTERDLSEICISSWRRAAG